MLWKFKKLKKRYIGAIVILAVLLALYSQGISPRTLTATPNMLVGFSAKMACSLYFVGALKPEQITHDLSAYSPLFAWPEQVYDQAQQQVRAQFWGVERVAQYRDGLGCTLIPQAEPLVAITTRPRSQNIQARLQGEDLAHQQLAAVLAEDNRQGRDTRALLIMDAEGHVVAEAYAEGFGPHSLFLGWSLAKTFTATLMGYVQRVQASLPPAQTTHLFSSWRQDARANISLENLLTMTTGLAFDERYIPDADATKMLFEDTTVYRRAMASALAFNPGEHWAYSSGAANLLAFYIHQQLGGNPDTTWSYLQHEFLPAVGMPQAIVEPDGSGVFVASSFMFASAEAWANMGRVYLNKGMLDGRMVLSEAWVQKATAPNHSQNERAYGYHLWLNHDLSAGANRPLRWPDLPSQSFAALGSKGQLVMVIPERQWVVVRLGWSKDKYPVNELIAKLLNAVP